MYMQNTSTHQLPLAYPSAIFPSRLHWLCLPAQIERTLLLLYYLNIWKKATQQLLYADRLGLLEIQALILGQAVQSGLVQAMAYLDGTRYFPNELLLESVAENAAKGLLIHMRGLTDPDIWPPFFPDGDRVYQQYIRPFYRRITGKDFPLVADAANVLDLAQIRAYIQDRLDKLVERARVTRQPISLRRLSALCIAPVDLLHIRDNRIYFLDGYESWADLDISDLRKLDPEGFSEIAFRYLSPTAEFVFHLPFRRAISLISQECLGQLQRMPSTSQPQGIYQGQQIDEAESLKHPPKEILQDLGVDIASICPHQLLEKETYMTQPSIRDILWPTHGSDNEDWDDDPWDGVCLPRNLIQ
jgi:hypothetical protein